jgi:hypothetical protein
MCQNSSSFFLAESNRLTEEQSKVMRMPTSTKKMSVKHGHFAVQTRRVDGKQMSCQKLQILRGA